MKVLFISACVRNESRTLLLANDILKKYDNDFVSINLDEIDILPLNQERLSKRDELISLGKLDDPMFELARQFSEAEEIIIAAPFWDLGFPSILKVYFENINVAGITFKYVDGRPKSLCKAKKLIYITTAGGVVFDDYGYSYVKSLATNFYGIEDVCAYRIEKLDMLKIPFEKTLEQEIKIIK